MMDYSKILPKKKEMPAGEAFMSKNSCMVKSYNQAIDDCLSALQKSLPMTEEETDYIRGLKTGVRLYAWWKEGTQYVGTCGTTLKHALERIDKDEKAKDY